MKRLVQINKWKKASVPSLGVRYVFDLIDAGCVERL